MRRQRALATGQPQLNRTWDFKLQRQLRLSFPARHPASRVGQSHTLRRLQHEAYCRPNLGDILDTPLPRNLILEHEKKFQDSSWSRLVNIPSMRWCDHITQVFFLTIMHRLQQNEDSSTWTLVQFSISCTGYQSADGFVSKLPAVFSRHWPPQHPPTMRPSAPWYQTWIDTNIALLTLELESPPNVHTIQNKFQELSLRASKKNLKL